MVKDCIVEGVKVGSYVNGHLVMEDGDRANAWLLVHRNKRLPKPVFLELMSQKKIYLSRMRRGLSEERQKQAAFLLEEIDRLSITDYQKGILKSLVYKFVTSGRDQDQRAALELLGKQQAIFTDKQLVETRELSDDDFAGILNRAKGLLDSSPGRRPRRRRLQDASS